MTSLQPITSELVNSKQINCDIKKRKLLITTVHIVLSKGRYKRLIKGRYGRLWQGTQGQLAYVWYSIMYLLKPADNTMCTEFSMNGMRFCHPSQKYHLFVPSRQSCVDVSFLVKKVNVTQFCVRPIPTETQHHHFYR